MSTGSPEGFPCQLTLVLATLLTHLQECDSGAREGMCEGCWQVGFADAETGRAQGR